MRIALLLMAALVLSGTVFAQDATAQPDRPPRVGVLYNSDVVEPGYVLFSPLTRPITYLINNNGQVVHAWPRATSAVRSAYLLENGNLLRTLARPANEFEAGRGRSGMVDMVTWEGDRVWSFEYATDLVFLHHDVEPLPNGNVLMVAWEYVAPELTAAAGLDPATIPEDEDGAVWSEQVFEYDPVADQIVWQWRLWDHIIQDYDSNAPTFGDVGATPGKVDLNVVGFDGRRDWIHMNAVDYNAELDQIMVSSRSLSEIWIIDHSISTSEARGPAGDLLWRYGNPAVYRSDAERTLFRQHDSEWIDTGLRGAGNIMVFNNGEEGVQDNSSVMEMIRGDDYGEAEIVWRWDAPFFAQLLSGAQRLPGGNTLVCDGSRGRCIELSGADDLIVWEYINPDFTPGEPNRIFRGDRYPPDYPAFTGRDLSPKGRIRNTGPQEAASDDS